MSSTMEEGRVKRLITLHDIKDGWLPIPVVYYGCHPGRLSGDDEINMQNLPRVETKNGVKKGHLRYAVIAPAGYSVLAADFSNIEARIVATLAGEAELREGFRSGADIYSSFASKIYGREINKKDDPNERFVGKGCILGLGYGMGWKKFQLKMAQEGIMFTDDQAKDIVYLYRCTYPGVPALWRHLEYMASTYMLTPDVPHPSEMANLIFANERIILPNGMPLMYPGLRHDGDGYKFDSRFAGVEVPNFIWGGTWLENISQALARIIAVRAELRLARRGLIAAHQVHDELIWVVPTAIVDRVKPVVALSMCEAVDFLPALPIAIEIKHGPTYGDAK
jgi:DNA polymerase